MTTILNTYLMWIGSESYKTIEDWTAEAIERGVSKRLPNEYIGEGLMESGTVIFVAHDEGDMYECEECASTIECPDCRKAQASYDREAHLADKLQKEAEAKVNHGMGRVFVLDAKERKSALNRATNAVARCEKLDEEMDGCERCLGTKEITAGSGGTVVFEDGSVWDHRRYMYHRNQPKKWTAADKGGIAVNKRCERCGGSGRLPNGKVFGLVVPEAIEYVESGNVDKDKAMADRGFKIVTATMLKCELKRKCGVRKPGGVYAVTAPGSESTAGGEAADALGINEVEVKGNFVQFMTPVDISGTKRFRGLARWELPEAVEDEAEMITEALV